MRFLLVGVGDPPRGSNRARSRESRAISCSREGRGEGASQPAGVPSPVIALGEVGEPIEAGALLQRRARSLRKSN
jgi:hypothetical protein